MPVIYIRYVRDRDKRALKVAASAARRGFAEYCLKVLLGHIKKVKKNGSDPVARPVEEEAKPVVAVAAGGQGEVIGKGVAAAQAETLERRLMTSEAMRRMREGR